MQMKIFLGKRKCCSLHSILAWRPLLDTCNMTDDTISEKIHQVYFDLDPELCVGFCFDITSVMSGAKGGVQTILKYTFPHAVCVHCCSHFLNLVLSSVAKVSRREYIL